MGRFLLTREPAVRLAAFTGVLAVMAVWELSGARGGTAMAEQSRRRLIDTLLVGLLFPTAAVGLALLAEARGWGLFSASHVPAWAAVIASVILLDLAIYLQHVLFHAVPALWRLHRMHHADLEFDVTTGVRFHPIEILLSMVIKLAVVAALGAPAVPC